MDKSKFLEADKENDTYLLNAGSVIGIVQTLLDIIMAFVPHDQLKDMIDKRVVEAANAAANANEVRKFGESSQ